MGHAGKIFQYELHNMLRSKWLIGIAATLLVMTEARLDRALVRVMEGAREVAHGTRR